MKQLSRIALFALLLFSCKQHRSDKAGKKMQDFIIEISNYARSFDANFIVIPQNGAELLFNDLNADGSLNPALLAAINGIGIEELYFNGAYEPDDYRLQMLLKAKASLKVLVADYHQTNTTLPLSFQYADSSGFIAFPRASNNYDYLYIPDSVHHENTNNILSLSQAQNYLYLISTGGFPDKASYLAAIQQTNFDVVIIDAFYGDQLLSNAEVAGLKTKANGAQRLVIAYMNVGTAEKYRYYWKEDWKIHHPRWLKKEYDGYPDEVWVKYWKQDWKDIIYGNDESYTKKLLNAGFDGAYLDNVEAFYFLYFND
jgi:cysteinyl-tRNA synthetase, unknown class